jgi:hypothetical protein
MGEVIRRRRRIAVSRFDAAVHRHGLIGRLWVFVPRNDTRSCYCRGRDGMTATKAIDFVWSNDQSMDLVGSPIT